jgi:hypothetical protein
MAWCGVPLIILTAAGFALAGFLPVPPGANWNAHRITEFYASHPTAARLGILLATIGLGLLGPMTAAITSQIQRIHGATAALANLQQLGGTCVVIVAVLPMIIMNVAAFRPDRDAAVTQGINDLAWLLLLTPIGMFILQEIPIAFAIFLDKSAKPVFPRWVGYSNLWIPLSFLPAFLPYFAKTGPVSWQGALTFYLGFITFGLWVIIMTWALLRATSDAGE